MTADFIRMEEWDRERRAPDCDDRPTPPLDAYSGEVGRDPIGSPSPNKPSAGGYIRPEAGHREADIKAALLPLANIEPVLERNYLVKGWLLQGAASVIYGLSNVGKTFLALDMALHVAAGVNWHGNRTRSDGETGQVVIYIAAEGGTGVHNRLTAFRLRNPDVYARAETGGFRLLSLSIDLYEGADTDRLIEVLNDLGLRPALIVIDTLARAMGNGDENTAQDMGKFVASIDRIRAETGAHVMAIHHSGKDASRGARGSSSLRGAVDTEIAIAKEGNVITAKAAKQRDMPIDKQFHYTLSPVELGTDEDGDQVTSCVVKSTDAAPERPKLSERDEIARQALDDALDQEGEVFLTNKLYPKNRKCVPVKCWKEWCKRHELAGGIGGKFETAFFRAKTALQEKKLIRIVNGHVWRCPE